jgi:threonine/homoserine/homoserine lactone efflux protein
MTTASLLALAAAVLVLGLTPGPVVIATVARALASGLAPALAFVVGVATIDLAYLLLAVYGLSAIAQWLGEFFIGVRILGGAYLIWLGVKLWLARGDAPGELPPVAGGRALGRAFGEGILVDLGNPKLILFYAAFLPTFVNFDRLAAADVAAVAAITVGILLALNIAFAWMAARARAYVRSRRAMTVINRTSGTLMIGAGAWVATR